MFEGIYTALVTPFQADGSIDREGLRELLHQQTEAGIHGVVLVGTTGESPTLSHEEKKTVIQIGLEVLKGTKTRVLAGTGTNNTRESLELSTWAANQGVDGLLIVTPYYNKPTKAGLAHHFLSIAEAVHCPLVLYNVPSRTGTSLPISLLQELTQHPRMRTIKEATGQVELTSQILDQLRSHASEVSILSGDDATFWPLMGVGGRGVISVASQIVPEVFMQLWGAHLKGDLNAGRALHQKYYPLFRDLFLETNPGPTKYLLSKMTSILPGMRPPLAALEPSTRQKLDALFLELDLGSKRGLKQQRPSK